MKSIFTCIVLMAVLFSSGCKTDSCRRFEKENAASIKKFMLQDSIISDIPQKENGKLDYYYYERMKRTNEIIKLQDLDPVGDLSIRIFTNFNEEASESWEVLSLSYTNGQWRGKYFVFNGPADDSLGRNIHTDCTDVTPKNGWCAFIHELLSYNILYMPTTGKTAGNSISVAHGGLCFFEIATKNKYRFYFYYDAWLLKQQRFHEGEQVLKIFECLDKNFWFSRLIN